MKTINIIAIAAAVVVVIVLSSVQSRREGAPPPYNAAAESKVSGVVLETPEFFCPVSEDQGAHLLLRTERGELLVHVAPGRFLRSEGFRFSPNDQVSVVGTMIHYHDRDAMLAREITRGNEVLIVRDRQGAPLWKK